MGAPLVREKKGSVVGVVALGRREESYKPESGQPLAPGRYRRACRQSTRAVHGRNRGEGGKEKTHEPARGEI
jgi:hypothetical protein